MRVSYYVLKLRPCFTWNAAVRDPQKLVVSAWVTERGGADRDATSTPPGTRPVHQEMYVDVAVSGERYSAATCQQRVVTTEPRRLEHYHGVRRTSD